jgi:hypothetical protein
MTCQVKHLRQSPRSKGIWLSNGLEAFQKEIGVGDFSMITAGDFSVVIVKGLDNCLNEINLGGNGFLGCRLPGCENWPAGLKLACMEHDWGQHLLYLPALSETKRRKSNEQS